MELMTGFAHNIFWFLVVLTLVVFIHELGHYSVAKMCGVKVEVFSVGFGREIFGVTDKAGTRWKFSFLPLGGYVKFYGDLGYSGEKDQSADAEMSDEERKLSFHYKSLGQKSAIVAAGPLANLLLAVVISTLIFSVVGRSYTPPVIDVVMEGSVADLSGIQPGDRIVKIGNKKINRFEEVQQVVMFNPGKMLDFTIDREGKLIFLPVAPARSEFVDPITGNTHEIGLLGVSVDGREVEKVSFAASVVEAVTHTYSISIQTLQGIGQIITLTRSAKELGGPILIAQLSGAQAANGPVSFFGFVVVLSITLGLINFFPIPMLDGGHLLFYFVELVRGKPLGARIQEYFFRMGFAIVIMIMAFAIFNDLSRPNVVEFFSQIIS
ncbi:MAG: RIP metalloprotease RseP [Rhodospirillaceae bacterium]|nr:RIP metalloprotease RseP [Rhodospirillaceae bacterium]